MGVIQLSQNQVIQYFIQLAAQNERINTFGFGPIYDIGRDTTIYQRVVAPNSNAVPAGELVYPLMWVEPVPNTLRKDSLILKHKIHIIDLVEKDLSNRMDVLSDSLRTCMELKAFIFKDFYYDIFPSDESILTPVFEKYDDEVTGYVMELELQLDWLADVCNIPGMYPSDFTFISGPTFYNVQLGSYLPLVGGTLTGPLSGTSADFSLYFSAGTPLETIIYNIADGTTGLTHDFYTTGATLVGDVAFFDRNDLLSAYTLDLSSLVSGGTGGGFSGWTASTGFASIVANNNSGNIAADFAIAGGQTDQATGVNSFIGGGYNNTASGYIATIAGGGFNRALGAYSMVGGGRSNSATTDFSIVVGGQQNYVSGIEASVLGGFQNKAIGFRSVILGGAANSGTNQYSTVVNGSSNQSNGNRTIIGNGYNNQANGNYSSVLNGYGNFSNGIYSSIIGGNANIVTNDFGVIAGGQTNRVDGSFGFVGAGNQNQAYGSLSFVGAGQFNSASTTASVTVGGIGNQTRGAFGFVGGGKYNNNGGRYSVIGGGNSNYIKTNNYNAVIAGGASNRIDGNYSVIGGGESNILVGQNSFMGVGALNILSGDASTIVAGNFNKAYGSFNFQGNGKNNFTYGYHASILNGSANSAATSYSTILGGVGNLASGPYSYGSTVVSGAYNRAYGSGTIILGGQNNLTSGFTNMIGTGQGNYTYGHFSTVINGNKNYAIGYNAVVVGGGNNRATGYHSFIGNGSANHLIFGLYNNKAASKHSFIGNGYRNSAETGYYSTVLNGKYNQSSGYYSVVLNGKNNRATTGTYGLVLQGYQNIVTGGKSTILNGGFNTITGDYSTIIGGSNNKMTGNNSVIASLNNFTGSSANTLFVQTLSIQSATTNNALANVLVRSGNGEISIRNLSSAITGVTSGLTFTSTTVNNGTNTFTGGTSTFQSVNITGGTVNNWNITGGTLSSGGTNLYSIFQTTADGNDITRVQPGSNITTGGTGNFPIISTVASPSFNSVTASGASSFTTLTATTFISGSTNLYSIFALAGSDTNDITRVQPGINTYTGGTGNNPTINVSAGTFDHVYVSGYSTFVSVSGTSVSASTVQIDNYLRINTGVTSVTNPERILVNDGVNNTFANVFVGRSSAAQYAQLNIQNTSGGTGSSSDIVATANNGDESTFFVDMGINSSAFNGSIGVANDAYLYSQANDLWIGNNSSNKHVNIFTDVATNSGIRINITSGQTTVTTPLSATTISATTIYSNLISANTISATTYYNMPDVFGNVSDGLGGVLATGVTGYRVMTTSGTITGWNIISNLTGNVVFDIWKMSGGTTLPTVANTIVGAGTNPQLTGALFSASTAVNTWTTTFNNNDVFAFNVNSVTGITWASLTISYIKN